MRAAGCQPRLTEQRLEQVVLAGSSTKHILPDWINLNLAAAANVAALIGEINPNIPLYSGDNDQESVRSAQAQFPFLFAYEKQDQVLNVMDKLCGNQKSKFRKSLISKMTGDGR